MSDRSQTHRALASESTADEALGDSLAQFRSLLEHVPAMVLTVGLDARVLLANRSHFGFELRDVIGRSIFDFPGPAEMRAEMQAAFARVLSAGEGTDYEVAVDWEGTTRWFAGRMGPVMRDGRITGVTLIATETTARKQMEQTLLESEQRFRRIADQSPDVIFRLGRGGIEYISPAFATMLGRSPAERATNPSMGPQHVHPDDLPKLAGIIAQLDRGPVRCELRMLHRDGHTVWTEYHLMPILSPAGTRIAVEGIVRDISERKRAAEALEQVHRELESRVASRTAELAQANAALREEITHRLRAEEEVREHQAALAHVLRVSTMGEMAAGLAHEINQPLGAIANFANGIATRLRNGTMGADAMLDTAQQIAAEALRAGEVIRRLRNFVRRVDSKREPSDVNALVRDAAHLVEPDVRNAGIALRLALDTRLPRVEIDPIQIEQVLLNLLRNGLEAMAPGAQPGDQLLVETLLDGRAVKVHVRDSGPGVPPATIDRIFDAFFTTKPSGLGMGLSISRSIVEDHGGRLWVQSNLDRGSTFGFGLPLAAESAAPRGPDAATTPRSGC